MKKFYKVRKWDRVELKGDKTVYEVNIVYYSKSLVYVAPQITHLSQIIYLDSLAGLNSKIVGPFRNSSEITKIF